MYVFFVYSSLRMEDCFISHLRDIVALNLMEAIHISLTGRCEQRLDSDNYNSQVWLHSKL